MCHEEEKKEEKKWRKWGQETKHKEQPDSVFLKDNTVHWQKKKEDRIQLFDERTKSLVN